MNYITKIRKAEYILQHYGAIAQMFKTQEEMGELSREIINFLTDKPYNLEEEIADVQIMLLQLQIALNADNIERIIEEKLDRQIARIKVEIEEKEKEENERLAVEKQEGEENAIPELTDAEMEHLDKVFKKSAGVSDEANKEE